MKNLKPSFDAVGIDIGTHTIKMAYLKNETLAKLGLREISPDTALTTMPAEEKDKLIANVLKQTLAENQVSVKRAVISISGDAVVVRYIILPQMSQKDLETTIKFEAEPYISFPLDQAILDFQILGDNEGEETKRMDVLLVAGKKELIDRQVNIIKNVGLRPVLIDVDSFALETLFDYNIGEDTNTGGIVLLNIGATFTNINIIENGVSRFARDIAIAGNNLTKALQRDLRLDYRKAEELKKIKGLILSEDEDEEGDKEAEQISDILKPVCHELLGEIRRSLDYYQAQSSDRSLKKIILTGGTAKIKNLEKIITQETKLPVERINPFEKVKFGVKNISAEQLSDLQPFFAVCLGLALRVRS
ncbi:MAG: type IV pilus assembly protein PilM [Elusimicrobia bacterium]|nr:type IV pilus assembly protein PilM [Elusimicrobiota bacterium]